MSWFSAVASVAAARQASAAGKFNQAIQNRNAQVGEQKGLLIEKQKEFDLATFDKKFEEANFARIQGNVARQQAKAAEIGYYAQAGTSLMKAYG